MKLNIGDVGQMKIQQIAASDPRKAELLKKYGLDYSFGRELNLDEACRRGYIDKEEVIENLNTINTAELPPSQNMNYWDVDFMCDYIVRIHHEYIRRTSKYLCEDVKLLCENHGDLHVELNPIQTLLVALFAELNPHMINEETILFPTIKKLFLIYAHPENLKELEAVISDLIKPISIMVEEHDKTGGYLNEMRELTDNYRLPENVDLPYRIFYEKLQELENDLKTHIHLENNILFPKALELGQKFDPIFG